MSSNESRANGVNGISIAFGRNPSPGMDCHVQQVTPDRHQAAVRNKEPLRMGTWNVRTMSETGKLENVKREMDRLKINILGISEMRWTGAGKIISDDKTIIFSGGERCQHGVGVILDKERSKSVMGFWAISERIVLVKLKGQPFNLSIIQVYAPTSEHTDEEIEAFYEDLEKARKQCKSQEIILIMGDMNVKVGKGREGNIVGPHGLGTRNVRGERWVEWCQENNQVIMNTWFQHHPRRLYTWVSPGDRSRNQIDYITVNQRFRNAVQQVKGYPGADCASDHVLLVCHLQVKLRKLKKPKVTSKLEVGELKHNPEMKEQFTVEVKNRYSALESVSETPDAWVIFRDAIVEVAESVLPKKKTKAKQQWMTAEILDMMDRRRATKQENIEKYKQLDESIKKKCNEEKETWLNSKCEQVESLKNKDARNMHQEIKEIVGRKVCVSSGCIRAKDGSILLEKEDIMSRWTEYIGELFEDERGGRPVIRKEVDGPSIMQEEVQYALHRMKNGKATGPDNIAIELVKELEGFGVQKVTEIANNIYNTGLIPTDLNKSVFIALPKKPGAIECELHRTISLMSHITKLILNVLLKRMKTKIREEISQEQNAYMRGKGTRNAIFILRMLGERAIEV